MKRLRFFIPKIIAGTLTLIQSSLLLAQTTSPLTLTDALALAEKNYPALLAKQEEVNAAKEDLSATRKEYIPTLKLHEQIEYATANTVEGTYFPYGIVVPTSGGIGETNSSAATFGSISMGLLEWSPFSFGQYNSRVQLYRSQLELATANSGDAVFQQKIKIAEAYLNVLTLQQVTKLSKNNLARTEAFRQSTSAAVIGGIRPGVDTAFANAEVSKARLELIDAQENEDAGKIYLASLIGLGDTTFIIDTTLTSKLPPLALNLTRVDVAQNPLALVYKANLDISLSREKYIQRSYYPRIGMISGIWGRGSGWGDGAGNVRDYSFAGGTALTRYNYAFGAAVTFNVFDFYRIHSQYEAEHFRTSAIQDDLDAVLLQMRSEQAIADLKVHSAVLRMNEAPIQLTAASALYDQTNARYKNGLATEPDLAQALYNMNRAESDMVNATDGLWRALLYKSASNGNIDDFLFKLK